MSERSEITVSTLSILKVLFIGLLVWFLFSIRDILLLVLISVIIASAIDPLADFLYKKRIPRALSVLLVYAVVLAMLGSIVWLLIPPMTAQFEQISQSNYYETFLNKAGIARDNLGGSEVGKTIQNNLKDFASNLSGTLSGAIFQTTKGVVSGIVSAITILAISFYLTVEENGMKNLIKHLTPYRHQAYAMKLVNRIQRKMGAWVLGQFILSLLIFGLTFIGLSLLKVEFALVLALIAGILEIIPYIGPFIAAIPALFFAFLQNPPLALAVLILYIVIQQAENHIVVPIVMSKSVGLNPVIVIIGILVGGTLGGIVGAVVAVPLVSGIAVFVQDTLVQDEAQSLET